MYVYTVEIVRTGSCVITDYCTSTLWVMTSQSYLNSSFFSAFEDPNTNEKYETTCD